MMMMMIIPMNAFGFSKTNKYFLNSAIQTPDKYMSNLPFYQTPDHDEFDAAFQFNVVCKKKFKINSHFKSFDRKCH